MPSQAQAMAEDAPEHTAKILRVAAGFRVEALAVLKDLELDLTKRIQAMGDVDTVLKKKYIDMLKGVNASISEAYELLGEKHTDHLQALAEIEGKAVIGQLNKSVGVDLFSATINPKMLEAVANGPVVLGNPAKEWWAGQSEALRRKFSASMGTGVLAGDTNEKLVARLRGTKAGNYQDGLMQVSRRDAQTLVRTSAISISNYARIETFKAMPDVIKGIQWVSTLDARTTDICKALSGLQWRLPDLQPVGHSKAFPGATAHMNCFTGDVSVSSPAKVHRAYRRSYSGKLITIQTANGRAFTATPNHPILTARGWVAIGELNEGDQLICQQGNRGEIARRGPEDQESQVSFAEFVESFSKLPGVVSVEMPVARPDFHGDGSNKEICQVWSNGSLSNKPNATPPEFIGEGGLQRADIDSPGERAGFGGPFQDAAILCDPASGGIGRRNTGLFATTPAGGEIIRARAGNPGGDAPPAESGQSHAVLLGDLPGGHLIGGVELDSVMMISSREAVAVFVHNLETATGWYLAQGVVAHNCRSTQVGVTYSWSELAGKKLATLDNATLQEAVDQRLKEAGKTPEQIAAAKVRAQASMDGQVSEALEYERWADRKGDAFIEQVLGPGRATLYKAGAITFSDLTDQSNRPLRLAQLKASIASGKPPPETVGAEFLPSTTLESQKVAAALAKAAAEKAKIEKEAYEAYLAYQEEKKALDALKAEMKAKEEAAAAEAKAQAEALKAKLKAEAEEAAKLKEEQVKAKALEMAKLKAEAEAAAALKAQKDALGAKVMAGKKLTLKDKQFLATLDPAEASIMQAIADEMAAAKAAKAAEKAAKAAAKAAAAQAAQGSTTTAQKAVVQAVNASTDAPAGIPSPDALTVVKKLGGSTGAELHRDDKGGLWVVKAGASPDHIREEWTADQLYRALGVPVPDGHLFETDAGPIKVTRFIEGKTFGDLSAPAKAKAAEKLREHFAADALLGNWDVIGLGQDNILVAADGTPYRIDNGGSLRFRAQGTRKGPDQWHGTPDEWFTLREKGNAGGVFASVDLSQASRFAEGWDLAAIERVNMEQGLREVLIERAGELKVAATRTLDMLHDGIRADYPDRVTAKTWELKKAGLREMIPQTGVSVDGYETKDTPIIISQNGVKWKGFRATGMAAPATATGPEQIAASGPEMAAVKAAAVSINYAASNGVAPSASGAAKIAAAKSQKAALQTLAALPPSSDLNKAKSAAAKHALDILQEIEAQPASGPAKPLKFFDPAAAAKAVLPTGGAAPAPPSLAARAVSMTDLAYQMHAAKYGGNTAAMRDVSSWMSEQASSSWRPQAQVAKHYMASLRPGADYWVMPPNTPKSIKALWDAAALRAGGEDRLIDAFETWHAMNQEVLRLADLPFIDKDRRVVRLLRTNPASIVGNAKPGGVVEVKQGSAESHSLFRATQVHEKHLVEQAVPFHRVLGGYYLERTPGSRSSAFLGDHENELVGDGSNIKGVFRGVGKHTEKTHKNKTDASTWGLPLDHLRP